MEELINWYNSPTGVLGTGVLNCKKYYYYFFYAVANAAGCASGTRTPVVAVVTAIPVIINPVHNVVIQVQYFYPQLHRQEQ
jgi:hypothetical protein